MLDLMRDLLRVEVGREETAFANVALLLERVRAYDLYPDILTIDKGVNEPQIEAGGRTLVQFGANNYLSMSENPAVKAAAEQAIEQFGIGPGGSRLMSGNIALLEKAEGKIAALTGMEECLTFPTGYMANVTVFQALMTPFAGALPYRTQDSIIFVDEYIHGSVMDGCRLAGVRTVKYKHNNLTDLQARLSENDNFSNKLIVTEGVYCLEGEIVDIPAYIEIARAHKAKLMVDDAHAIGVIGSRGGGSPDYHGCAKGIDILMGCMDKAIGGTGGYLCGSKELVDYLRIAANSSVLSSALPCSMAAAVIVAIELIEKAGETRQELARKSRYLREGLQEQGLVVMGHDYIPSVPLLIGDEALGVAFARELLARGIFCPVMRWPAVPLGKSRLRLSLMARHTQEHLDLLIEACGQVGRELGLTLG